MILFSLRHTNPKTAAHINGHAKVPIGAQATIQAAVPENISNLHRNALNKLNYTLRKKGE